MTEEVESKVILVVEDDDSWFDMVKTLLEYDYEIERAKTLKEAKDKLQSGPGPDLVLVNRTLTEYGDAFGERFLLDLRRERPDLPRVLVTGHDFEIEPLEYARTLGLTGLIPKNQFKPGQLLDIVKKILEAKNRKLLVACKQLHPKIPRYILHSYHNDALKEYPDLQLFCFTIDNQLDEELDATLLFEEHSPYIQQYTYPLKLKKEEQSYYCSPLFTGQAGDGAIIAVSKFQLLLGERVIWKPRDSYKFQIDNTLPIGLKEGATGDLWTHFLIVTCITRDSSGVTNLAGEVSDRWREENRGSNWPAGDYVGDHALKAAKYLRILLKERLTLEGRSYQYGEDEYIVSHAMRLPDKIIANRRANCLYYSLLYASVLENLDIYPLLLFIPPGHVLPGWKKWADDRPYEFRSENFETLKEWMVFIEGTLTSTDEPFEELLKKGQEVFQQAQELAKIEKPVYILDVKQMRSEGFDPYDGEL